MPKPTSGPGKPEPSRLILLDLVALVVGAAILASVHWWSTDSMFPFGGRGPAWYVALLNIREATSKACLALVPVIIARRLQFGGLIRPAELLVAAVGLPELALAATEWPILRLIVREGDRSIIDSMRAYHVFQAVLAALGLIGVALVLIGRRRWPDAIRSGGLLLVLLGLQSGGIFWIDRAVRSLVGEYRPDLLTHALVFQAVSWPLTFALTIPGIAAFRSFRRRASGPTWLEWAGLVLSIAAFLAIKVEVATRARLMGFPRFEHQWAISTAAFLLAVAISLPIVRRIGPAWDLASKIAYTEGPRTPAGNSPGGSP